MIVDHNPKGRHKRFDKEILKSLEALSKGSPVDILFEAALASNAASIKEVVFRSRLDSETAESALKELVEAGRLIPLEEGVINISSDLLVIALPHWITVHDKTLQIVKSYHQSFPLRAGIPREELKSKLKLTARVFNNTIKKLGTENTLIDSGGTVALAGHEIRFDSGQQAKIGVLLRKFEQDPYSPPTIKECYLEAGEEIVNALIQLDELVLVSDDVIFRKQDYDSMVAKIRESIKQKGNVTLAEVRDIFKTSRKYAQALLEHLDATGVTVRDGDFRKLRNK
jgi:selenocysteine-specific elongation factor